ncbi:hypothetical protein XH93_08850 [Bradyrhizobium sp. CCBAU 51753]|nr:hypothetical protein XH93_08850 [Bradyrhizobium sp. CCBAU 51753]
MVKVVVREVLLGKRPALLSMLIWASEAVWGRKTQRSAMRRSFSGMKFVSSGSAAPADEDGPACEGPA